MLWMECVLIPKKGSQSEGRPVRPCCYCCVWTLYLEGCDSANPPTQLCFYGFCFLQISRLPQRQ